MMAIGQALRMAGPKLFNFLKGDMTNRQLLYRIAPDAFFSGMAAVQTPGDLLDKTIVGLTDLTLSAGGGLAAGGVGARVGLNKELDFLADMGGSYAGAMSSLPVSNQLMRAKDSLMGGKGESPYERLGSRERKQFEDQMREQILQQYGLVPGARPDYYGQDYLAQLGLG
jgi:hypothetical protein